MADDKKNARGGMIVRGRIAWPIILGGARCQELYYVITLVWHLWNAFQELLPFLWQLNQISGFFYYFTKRKGLKYATHAWLKECAPRSKLRSRFCGWHLPFTHRPELLMMPSVIVGGSMDKGCPCLKHVYCMTYRSIDRNTNAKWN